ncbi:MAG: hypothetical protein AB8B65_19340 [Kordia sp.]|uniref:hypothetical protein n=1 Tax=Kordia sp. TaxID=1965332 RepID=UPI00385B34C2
MSKTFCEELYDIKQKNSPDLPGFCAVKKPWVRPTNLPESNIMTPIFQIPAAAVPSGLKEQYIYVGIGYGLQQNLISPNNIAGVLNVAYDVNDPADLQNAYNPTDPSIKKILDFELAVWCFPSLLSKVGLVDGNENNMMTLVSAIYMADQLLNFPSLTEQMEETTTNPGDPMTNFYQQGNLLIHCHDGGSRSVTITALYIYYKFFVGKCTFQEVYQEVICCRYEEASNHVPTQGICENAYEVLNTFKELFPEPVRK